MGSYGTNILSSSLDTMMGKNLMAGGIAAIGGGMRRHASATSMGVTTVESRAGGSGSASGGRGGGGGGAGEGRTHRSSSSQSKSKLLKSLKDQLATKQCPPVFLTASSASKGTKGHGSHHRKKRVKRTASRDDGCSNSSVASEGGDTGADRSMGVNDETGEDGIIVPELLSSMAALSTTHLPPLETVSEV